jgi:hypothetical protein
MARALRRVAKTSSHWRKGIRMLEPPAMQMKPESPTSSEQTIFGAAQQRLEDCCNRFASTRARCKRRISGIAKDLLRRAHFDVDLNERKFSFLRLCWWDLESGNIDEIIISRLSKIWSTFSDSEDWSEFEAESWSDLTFWTREFRI